MTDPRLVEIQRLIDKAEYANSEVRKTLMDHAFLKLFHWALDADKAIEAHNEGKVMGAHNLL